MSLYSRNTSAKSWTPSRYRVIGVTFRKPGSRSIDRALSLFRRGSGHGEYLRGRLPAVADDWVVVSDPGSIRLANLFRPPTPWLVLPRGLPRGALGEARVHVLLEFDLPLEDAGLDHEVADHVEVGLSG